MGVNTEIGECDNCLNSQKLLKIRQYSNVIQALDNVITQTEGEASLGWIYTDAIKNRKQVEILMRSLIHSILN